MSERPEAEKLPPLMRPSEAQGKAPEPEPPKRRVGFALVGVGHVALEQVLPGFRQCERARLTAIVSGHPEKARDVAQEHGVPRERVFSYEEYDRLKDVEEVEAVYIALPNDMHAEFTVRAAQAGKHVLCEKPMATSVEEGQRMIDACREADRLLMIAYRCQYEPHHLAMIRLCRDQTFGEPRVIVANNGQNQGPPDQWRLKLAEAGGGPLPDVGIYCLNAARYLTGEEPIEVSATNQRNPRDPRFREVVETTTFTLRFPSGVIAVGTCSYAYHESRTLRVMAERGWYELNPAFSYDDLRMTVGYAKAESHYVEERRLPQKNHFALEIDHFADCIREGRTPHTPGEEGLQDLRLMDEMCRSAAEGRAITLPPVRERDAFRGPLVVPKGPSITLLPEEFAPRQTR